MRSDIVIIGGGIMGSAAAAFLAEDGRAGEITVVEPDRTYQRSTTPNAAGGMRRLFSRPENIRMSQFSLDFYRRVDRLLAVDGAPVDIGFRQEGYLFVVSGRGAGQLEANVRAQEAEGVRAELLDTMALQARFPSIGTEDVALACHSPDDGWFDPQSALQAFRKKAESLGVVYLSDRVVGFETEAHAVARACLESGRKLAGGAFVNTAGAWAGEIARMLGAGLPIEPLCRVQHFWLCAAEIEPLPLVKDESGLFLRPEGRGFAGASTCALPDNDFYTRLGDIWDKLGVLLDPLGTGALDLDPFDPSLNPPPTTFNVTGVVPTQTPALVPGSGKSVQILGTGFANTTTVRLNGAPLPGLLYRRMSDQRIAIDMPQLALGQQTLTVEEGGSSLSVNLDVVSPTDPVHQAGSGDCGQLGGNVVSTFGGVQLMYSGQVGHTHVCYWSMSDLPSVHPLAMFDLGNQFTQLYFCSLVTIPAQGYFQETLSIPSSLSNMTIFSQTWCMSCGLPAQISNLQETFVF